MKGARGSLLPCGMPKSPGRIHRVEVSPKPSFGDPVGAALVRDAAALGILLGAARSSHVYLIQGVLSESQVGEIAARLLADPVTESARRGASGVERGTQVVEVHPLPGVMDPVAQTVREAIRELVGVEADVSTGWRYDLSGINSDEADLLASRLLANPVIQHIHREPWLPGSFPAGRSHEHAVRLVPIIDLSDEQLTRMSREAHLFLSLEEMKAIKAEYRRLGREPRDIELETLAQTWSEHCVHKTLKSTVVYRSDGVTERRSDREGGQREGGGSSHDPIDWRNRPGHTINADGSVTINNLLKSTVAAATHELIRDGVDWALSVFVDNAGVIAFDDEHAVCVKVETHNHPSAIEPYGGAATGIGGCIRDVIGTGLGARPIASTDVFCVAYPEQWDEGPGDHGIKGRGEISSASMPPSHDPTIPLPSGCLHPGRVLRQVVAGVRDYGNRMGIPTVSGAVAFDNRYVGNPLVFCGCIGVMPRDRIKGGVNSGDLIVALGGRTGRDGIHGATFSSAELEATASDEFSHAVQIGNAIEEKRVLDAIMRARDGSDGATKRRSDEAEQLPTFPLFSGLTDCGAGGFSSAIGEMGKDTGAIVHLDRAPLKYSGLSCTEIWISEAQERMVLAVPARNLDALQKICNEESVELAVLGEFTSPKGASVPELGLYFHGEEVGRLDMHFMHEGIPMPRREAVWPPPRSDGPVHPSVASLIQRSVPSTNLLADLLTLLAHPNIASKHWIIRQYDHEVRGSTVVKPLVGAGESGPSDASVIRPTPGSARGLAISQGLQTGIGDPANGGDPYLMALAAIDECVRNLVCVGADPARIAILDNFCWPSCAKPGNLGALVRAAEGCYDGAKAYRTPFVSGKDSLNNQFTIGKPPDARTIEVPPTLLITGIGIVPDIAKCITMDAKAAGNVLVLIGRTGSEMGGSHYRQVFGSGGNANVPGTDLGLCPGIAKAVHGLIEQGLIASAHDCSDGGLLCAVAEMLIGGSSRGAPIGASIDLGAAHGDPIVGAFSETPGRYVVEVEPRHFAAVRASLGGLPYAPIGALDESGELRVLGAGRQAVEGLREAWLGTLDWGR